MPGVLALDLATVTGWAIGPLPARPMTQLEAAVAKPPQPRSGFHCVAPAGTSVGRFALAYEKWIRAMLNEHRPGGVIFEAPILPTKTTPATVEKLMALVVITQAEAERHAIGWVRRAQPSSVKKHICGDGGPGKNGVMRAILERGWIFADDNECDALALFDYAAHIAANERRAA